MPVSLNVTRLKQAEQYCTAYAAVLPHDQSLDDALNPEYWANVAATLRQHDTIRIIPEDGSYFAELLVLDAARGYAKVKILRHVLLDEPVGDAEAPLIDLFVKWDGPHNKFTVIRKSDGEKLKTGFVEKTSAQRWLDDHLASMAR